MIITVVPPTIKFELFPVKVDEPLIIRYFAGAAARGNGEAELGEWFASPP